MTINSHLSFPTQLPLIGHKLGNELISQRPKDGYINATALCKAAGKSFYDYVRLNSTKDFLQELSTETGIPVSALYQTLKGGNQPELQGTWVHPDVATHLAQWLSPKFAVQVSKWVREWLTGQVSGHMPYHVKRYIKNRSKIPHTHFSMLNEIYLNLIAPLEEAGFVMPDKMIPDASTGRMFSGFLRKKGIHPESFPTYNHEFSDNRKDVQARLYPNKHLADFKDYFNREWLPKHAQKYFKQRAPVALPYIKLITPLELPPTNKK
ncbi:MAG: KilA-N domain-containing protein [Chromatiales bacterium]|nr:KilA-N domain-containing protein [Chromatiales bacterium]